MKQFLEGNAAVFGLQWGDEGKGKIVDYLAEHADVVVRYCGGANAGHTVKFNGETFSTHLLPVGVFRPGVLNCIGNGVVLDPAALLQEIDDLATRGVVVSPDNLRVSYKTHVVMPWHFLEDAARESSSEGTAIGTTRRGIGPTYADKMTRTTAVRVGELVKDEKKLQHRVGEIVTERNKVLGALYDAPPVNWRDVFEEYRDFGKRIEPFVDDVGRLLMNAHAEGKRILFEGAHAALLDVDHGTYPYVTSSNCSSLGIFTGTGVPPRLLQQYVGVLKSYSTRVGGGPFPTELEDDTGNYIRERGHEYGTTTGRPRRCGWFDAVAARYAVDLCGTTALSLMLLDVLSGLEHLRICTGYRHKGARLDYFRADVDVLAEVECVYETLPGWDADLSTCRRFDELPAEAKQYVRAIEQLCGAPVRMVSVGADRAATLVRE